MYHKQKQIYINILILVSLVFLSLYKIHEQYFESDLGCDTPMPVTELTYDAFTKYDHNIVYKVEKIQEPFRF